LRLDAGRGLGHDAHMRVSDAERERSAALLRRRCEEGYLSLDTFERRIEQVFVAKTESELGGLTLDLPAVGIRARLERLRARRRGRADSDAAPPAALRLPLALIGEQPVVLGRSHACDVLIEHETVSRRHAQLRRDGAQWRLRDLGSSNGTWVDGRRAEGEVTVARGQHILLGDCWVLLR
jgi:hypothetical protein